MWTCTDPASCGLSFPTSFLTFSLAMFWMPWNCWLWSLALNLSPVTQALILYLISVSSTLNHTSEELCCCSLRGPDVVPQLSIPVFCLSLFPYVSHFPSAQRFPEPGNLESMLTVCSLSLSHASFNKSSGEGPLFPQCDHHGSGHSQPHVTKSTAMAILVSKSAEPYLLRWEHETAMLLACKRTSIHNFFLKLEKILVPLFSSFPPPWATTVVKNVTKEYLDIYRKSGTAGKMGNLFKP